MAGARCRSIVGGCFCPWRGCVCASLRVVAVPGGRCLLAFAHGLPTRKNATARDSRVLMPGPTRCRSGAERRAGDGVLGHCGVRRAGRGACRRLRPAKGLGTAPRLSWDGAWL
ncbi:hypothetical protein TcYC6_0124070 [Trypanosoma cruzi]|nr:hypothetical protein TcYC6_0124070 [Trypanosoma cruzi]